MAHFRVEAVLDNTTKLYSLEAYYPAEATKPFVRTKPRFRTEEQAFEHFKRKCSRRHSLGQGTRQRAKAKLGHYRPFRCWAGLDRCSAP